MERLTRYFSDWAHGAEGVSDKGLTGAYCRGKFEATAIVDRLAAIEDILGDTYDLDHLRELVEAERDGRCVVLPCKLQEKVFIVENGDIKETEVDGFHQWISGRWKMSTNTKKTSKYWTGYEVDFDGIGKTAFLSREAAEQAMKEE